MISRGKVHNYLGMDLDLGTSPGTRIMSMMNYLQKINDEFPEVTCSKYRTMKIGNSTVGRWPKQFHQTVAKLLFLFKRVRPDVKTLVSFLTTRVTQPDKDEWGKLRHGLMYLKGTLCMKRYLTADNLFNIMWWVCGSFGVHWDSKGPMEAMLSMGRGAVVSITRKHKMNVANLTELELVSIANVLSMILLCKYFMEAQGYLHN